MKRATKTLIFCAFVLGTFLVSTLLISYLIDGLLWIEFIKKVLVSSGIVLGVWGLMVLIGAGIVIIYESTKDL